MPPKVIKSSKRTISYTAQTMREAYDSVQSGQYTGRQAAAVFKVPYGTLNKKLSGRAPIEAYGAGRPIEMGAENERKLAEYLIISGRYGYGLNRHEILELTGEFVREENIKTRWSRGKPGFDWLRNFLNRHPQVIVRKDEVCFNKQINSVYPFVVHEFYEGLEALYEKESINSNDAYRLYSLLEISFPYADLQKANLAGSSHRKKTERNGLNASVLTCISADGGKLPPLVVFQGRCVSCETSNDCNGTAIDKNSGDRTLFYYWFENIFLPLLPSSGTERRKSIILFFEGKSLQINIQILFMAKESGVYFVKFPPKLSRHLQPLDKKCSSSLKTAWSKQLNVWNRKGFQNMPDAQNEKFGQILGTTWTKCAGKNVIIKGFERTGLFPLDRHKFDETAFSESLLKKFEQEREFDPGASLENIDSTLLSSQPFTVSLMDTNAHDLETPQRTEQAVATLQDKNMSQEVSENASISSQNGSNLFLRFMPKKLCSTSSRMSSNSNIDRKEFILKEEELPSSVESDFNLECSEIGEQFQDNAVDLSIKVAVVKIEENRPLELRCKRNSQSVISSVSEMIIN